MDDIGKLPALQFYVGDWRKDPGVQALDFETRGVWFELLLIMHGCAERGKLLLNGKAMPEDAVAQLLGLSLEKTKQILSKLLAYGVASIDEVTGAICNRRMVRDESIRKTKAESGRLGGLAKAKQTAGEPVANDVAKRRSSSSSSSSSTGDGKNPSDFSCSEPSKTPASEPHHVPDDLKSLALFAADRKLCARWHIVFPEWKLAYPGVEILPELRKAHSWQRSDPKHQKKNQSKFLNSWLSRAQDDASRTMKPQPPSPRTEEEKLRKHGIDKIVQA